MLKLICDRCGASLDRSKKIGYIDWNFRDGLDGELGRNYFEKRHFCNDCMMSIFEVIVGDDSAPAPEKGESASEQEERVEMEDSRQQVKSGAKKGRPSKYSQQEPSQETRGRKGCDIGKILALRDAGWSFAKIADEMSMAENSVRVAISRHRKRMEEGKEKSAAGSSLA